MSDFTSNDDFDKMYRMLFDRWTKIVDVPSAMLNPDWTDGMTAAERTVLWDSVADRWPRARQLVRELEMLDRYRRDRAAQAQLEAQQIKAPNDHISGTITGVHVGIRTEKWEYGDRRDDQHPNTTMCYVYVTASIEDTEDDVVLIDSLLGIYSGDDIPIVEYWKSCGGGIATGPRSTRFDQLIAVNVSVQKPTNAIRAQQ